MGHGNAMSEICLKSAEKYLKSPIRSFTVGTSRTFFTGRDYLYFFRMSFFFPVLFVTPSIAFCFWVPFRFFFSFSFFCFNSFSLLLCLFAFLLFCFSAFLLFCFFCFLLLLCFSASPFFRFSFFCFFCFFCCFFASLLLRFFVFFLLFCFLLLLCFSACLLSFLCFSSSLGLSVLLWCLFYFSTFLCLMCHGKKHGPMGYFLIKAICHEFIHRDLYAHDKDCHCEMDDHTLYIQYYII